MNFAPEIKAYPIQTHGVDFDAAQKTLSTYRENFHQHISPEGWITSISLNPPYREHLAQKTTPPEKLPKYLITTSYNRGMGDFIADDKPYSAVKTTAFLADPAHPENTDFANMQLHGYQDQSKFTTVTSSDDFTVTVRDQNLSAHIVEGKEGAPFQLLGISYAEGRGEQEPFTPIEITYSPDRKPLPFIAKQDGKQVSTLEAISCAGELMTKMGIKQVAELPAADAACTLVPKVKTPEPDTRLK